VLGGQGEGQVVERRSGDDDDDAEVVDVEFPTFADIAACFFVFFCVFLFYLRRQIDSR
jgi:hypothetical protein